ncbi:MAG: phosphatidate cytidylyltransferase [Bacteroidales bacterium]|nr:phosphatidate cytidylyltransferase [Bacteroidales bacterium]
MKNLSRRTITGAFLVIIILGGIWLHPVTYLLIGALLLAVSIHEYYKLVSYAGIRPQRLAGIIAGITAYTISVLVSAQVLESVFYLIIIAELGLIMIIELYRKKDRPFDNLAHTVFGVIFISVPYSLFPFMAFGFSGTDTLLQSGISPFSPGLILGFLVLSWSFDTGAYLFGSWFGKHKLWKRISPEKSWEGFISGTIITLIIAWPVSIWIDITGLKSWLIIAMIISITGTLGDMVESMLKRSVGVKDSGSLLPGHGGMLDRFDSLILSLPFVFIYIILFV